MRNLSIILALVAWSTTSYCQALHISSLSCRRATTPTRLHAYDESKRKFLLATTSSAAAFAVSTLFFPPSDALASDEGSSLGDGLTASLYNPDGSLKEGVGSEAKLRPVEVSLDASDSFAINIDGANIGNTQKGSSVTLSYQLPEKWDADNEKNGIFTVYRVEGEVQPSILEKATRIGVAKALGVTDDLKDLKALQSADLISGRTRVRDGIKYYEFDMAVAPDSCEQSADDLRLGFCPYDTIYLLSATVVDNRLYVFAIDSNKKQWKRSNSDLKFVRSTFSVSSS